MAEEKELQMSFDPNTIEHLGVKMYSQIPTALAELVANSYDADAKAVTIYLFDDGESKRIVVEDNGAGMTFDEVNNEFLRIGRNRRDEGKRTSPSGLRKATGKKGLGKLALFGIGETIEVITTKNKQKVHFKMNWNAIKQTPVGENYKPEVVSIEDVETGSGTTIILSELKRKSQFNIDDMAISLSKLFNLFDKNFVVEIKYGAEAIEVTKELRYSSLSSQFEFDIKEVVKRLGEEYHHSKDLQGKVFTTEKPLKPGLRGITLFANGRLVQAPSFFDRPESSHFYSYATGWIEVDFIDDWKQDVISTNRQSLNWDIPETEALQENLQKIVFAIEREWKEKRTKKTTEDITEKTNINIEEWYSKLPDNLLPSVEKIVNNVVKKELTQEEQNVTVQELNKLVPAYTYYHYRSLHAIVQDASKDDYQRQDYYRAFLEAAKRYINSVRRRSGSVNGSEATMMMEVFGRNKILTVTKKYFRPDGTLFNDIIMGDIEEGQAFFSRGVVTGGRNPLSHEEIDDLRDSDLFSEKDCLDLLSLISHLFKRLDDAENR